MDLSSAEGPRTETSCPYIYAKLNKKFQVISHSNEPIQYSTLSLYLSVAMLSSIKSFKLSVIAMSLYNIALSISGPLLI